MPSAFDLVELPFCAYVTETAGTANLLVELAAPCVLAPERADRPGTVSFAFLKNSSSASGISEVSMSSSAIAAISASRFFEIGIEVFPFIPGRFARADDPCGPIPIRMDNAGYHYPTNETVAPLSHFALVPFVFKWKRRSVEDRGGFLKADSILALITKVLFLVPLEPAHVTVFGRVLLRGFLLSVDITVYRSNNFSSLSVSLRK